MKAFRACALHILLVGTAVSAQAAAPDPRPWAQWIPHGWTLARLSQGKLIGSNGPDALLVLEVPPGGKSESGKPIPPRRVIILEQVGGHYMQIGRSDAFIPGHIDELIGCATDPLEDGKAVIERGLIKIELDHWPRCGSWDVTNDIFWFRRDGARFRLIGKDSSEFSRNGGYQTDFSYNYLTNREQVTSDINLYSEMPKRKPKVVWKALKAPPPYYFDAMNQSDCDRTEGIPAWCLNDDE